MLKRDHTTILLQQSENEMSVCFFCLSSTSCLQSLKLLHASTKQYDKISMKLVSRVEMCQAQAEQGLIFLKL